LSLVAYLAAHVTSSSSPSATSDPATSVLLICTVGGDSGIKYKCHAIMLL